MKKRLFISICAIICLCGLAWEAETAEFCVGTAVELGTAIDSSRKGDTLKRTLTLDMGVQCIIHT